MSYKYSESQKIYYQKNKDKISKRAKAYYENNKEAIKIYRAKWYKENKVKTRVKQMKKKYGLTMEQYLKLLNRQLHCCAICKKLFPTVVFDPDKNIDHDHKTGNVRGILCNKCNMGISLFDDNKIILMSAIDYLNKKVYIDILNNSISVADMPQHDNSKEGEDRSDNLSGSDTE